MKIHVLPFIFEPCRDVHEEKQKSLFEEFGASISPLWRFILVRFQLYFLQKYGSILEGRSYLLHPKKSEIAEFKKVLSADLKSIPADDKYDFKKQVEALFWGKGGKRLSSPGNMAKMIKDYKKLLDDAYETLKSAIDCSSVLNLGKMKGLISETEIDTLLELSKNMHEAAKFGKEMALYLGRFPDKDRKALKNAFGVAHGCARKYFSEKEQEATLEVVRRLLPPPRKIPPGHRRSNAEILSSVCENFRRMDSGGGIEAYHNKTVAKEYKNFYRLRSLRKFSREFDCPFCHEPIEIPALETIKPLSCPGCKRVVTERYVEAAAVLATVNIKDDSYDLDRLQAEDAIKSGAVRPRSRRESMDLASIASDQTQEKKRSQRLEINSREWKNFSAREQEVIQLIYKKKKGGIWEIRKKPPHYDTIGERMGIQPKTASKIFSNALERLRKIRKHRHNPRRIQSS